MPFAVSFGQKRTSHLTLMMPGIYLGLAETLRQELLLYSIEVQIYMPVTMYTPGYEEENKTKPQLVLKLEESDSGVTPENAAEGLYEGTVLCHSPFFQRWDRKQSYMQACERANSTSPIHSSEMCFVQTPVDPRRLGQTFSKTSFSALLARYVCVRPRMDTTLTRIE